MVRTDADDTAALVSALAEEAIAFATEAFEAAATRALEDTVGAYIGWSGFPKKYLRNDTYRDGIDSSNYC